MKSAGTTKQRIIRIAAELFAQHGYHGSSVSQLSEATGLGRGALYYHIESKESLLLEISHISLEDMLSVARSVSDSNVSADKRIRLIARAHMRNIVDHLPEWTVFFREMNALSVPKRDLILRLRSEYEGIWNDLYDQGVKQGLFRDLDPIIVKGFLGMLNYAYVWIRPDGLLSPEQIADSFTNAFLVGILVRDEGYRGEPSDETGLDPRP